MSATTSTGSTPGTAPLNTPSGRRLVVGIDVRRSGGFGIGVYIQSLLEALRQVGPQHEYVLIGAEEHRRRFSDLPSNFRFALYDRRYNAPASHLDFGLEVRRLGLDIFHMPHGWVPFSTPRPYVATLHDLNHLIYTREGSSPTANRFRRAMLVRALKRASKIIAVSGATKADAVKRLNLAPNSIEVIPDAVDDKIRRPVDAQERRETLERYSIEDPFILYAGRIQPHKNVPRLIESFAVVKNQLENHWKFHHLKLIIIGDDMMADPNVRHTMLRTRTQASVRFLGFVPVETLRVFYAAATAFLFPSLHEGFGMPPLEAMSHGTPVVTSNVSSLPEAVGDAAVLVNPENTFDIARGLRRVLLDDEFREHLRRLGHDQVKKFSWNRTAEKTLEIYQACARKL